MKRKLYTISRTLGAEGYEALGLPVKPAAAVAEMFTLSGWPAEENLK